MFKRLLLNFITITTTLCIVFFSMCACSPVNKIEYYSQKQNYICVTGTISSVKYSKDLSALYIGFSTTSPVLDDTSFKIVGKNLHIVQTNKIDDKIKIGEQIDFMTAPKYFGDGYVMPIVSMSKDGESLLEFDVGYQNWIEWLSN